MYSALFSLKVLGELQCPSASNTVKLPLCYWKRFQYVLGYTYIVLSSADSGEMMPGGVALSSIKPLFGNSDISIAEYFATLSLVDAQHSRRSDFGIGPIQMPVSGLFLWHAWILIGLDEKVPLAIDLKWIDSLHSREDIVIILAWEVRLCFELMSEGTVPLPFRDMTFRWRIYLEFVLIWGLINTAVRIAMSFRNSSSEKDVLFRLIARRRGVIVLFL